MFLSYKVVLTYCDAILTMQQDVEFFFFLHRVEVREEIIESSEVSVPHSCVFGT